MWKVGDKVTRIGRAFGAARQEGTIVFIDEKYPDLVLVRTEHGINLWNIDRILPPPPTVVIESWINVYSKELVFLHKTLASVKAALDDSVHAGWAAETVHVYKLSDGTWHIERV